MAYNAQDGTPYTNKIGAVRHDARSAPKAKPATSDSGGGIESDPEAMQAIDLLKQKGYTAEDVSKAFDDDQSQDQPSPQPSAQPVQIPGM